MAERMEQGKHNNHGPCPQPYDRTWSLPLKPEQHVEGQDSGRVHIVATFVKEGSVQYICDLSASEMDRPCDARDTKPALKGSVVLDSREKSVSIQVWSSGLGIHAMKFRTLFGKAFDHYQRDVWLVGDLMKKDDLAKDKLHLKSSTMDIPPDVHVEALQLFSKDRKLIGLNLSTSEAIPRGRSLERKRRM